MAEEESTKIREPIGNYGKSLYGVTPVQDAKKNIYLIPQRIVAAVSDKNHITTRNYAFPRL